MNIFVSYRRSDTRHVAGRLAEKLDETPGVSKVFIDVDGIEPGSNFEDKIDSSLQESDVCLILIGDDWVGITEGTEKTRIQGDGDFVRLEAAAALASDTKVIPILVDGAPMPPREELPSELRSIVSIDAVFLRHNSFKQDAEHVEDAIFSRKARTPISRFFQRRPFLTLLLKTFVGVVIAAVVLLVLAIVNNLVTGGGLNTTFGSAGLALLFSIGVLVSGGVIAAWRALRR